MTVLSRRDLLAALVAALATPTLAETQTVEIGKAFPYLENYLKLPPAQRDRFRVAYRFMTPNGPAVVRLWLLEGGRQIPVPISSDGLIERLPSLAQLTARTKVQVETPTGQKTAMALLLEPILAPAAELRAADLVAALTQAAAGAKKVGGLVGFAIPKMDRVRFVGAQAGEVVYADGRRAALPVVKGDPVFDPAAWKAVASLRFGRAARRIEIQSSKS
jgi:hypothetical protein